MNPFQLIQIIRSLKIVTIKKLLGVNLNTHVTSMCNRVSKKLYALTKLLRFMGVCKERMTMKTSLLQNLVTTHWYVCSIVGN